MAFEFFKRLFSGGDKPEAVTAEEFFDLYSDTYIRELAFHACVSFIANAVSKCEFKTYREGQPVKGPEYYLWNVEPNQNQCSSAFFHSLLLRLYRDNEALVVEHNSRLYVADSYDREEYTLYPDLFRQVTVGSFTFSRTFGGDEVMYFRLNDQDVNRILRGLYTSYSKLITYGMKAYQQSRGTKGTLELDMTMRGTKDFNDRFNAIRNEDFRKFVEADNGILPLFKGMKFQELAHKTYTSDTTRDIRALIDDVTDFTARGFGIPAQIVNGTVQDVDSAVEQALTFCVDPLADMLQEEINRKRYGRDAYLKGNYIAIDTGAIKHVNVLDVAADVDKLVSSGVMCVNDVRGILGMPLINEPWAWAHFMTKNYADIEKLLEAMKGGETKDE